MRAKRLCETIEEVFEGTSREEEEEENGALKGKELADALLDAAESDGLDWEAEDDDDSDDSENFTEEEDIESEDDVGYLGDDVTQDLRDPSSDEDEGEGEDGESDLATLDLDRGQHKTKGSKRNPRLQSELDDGFFDLAAFNAEANEGEAKSVSRGRLGDDEDEDSDSDMSVDLFAPVDDAEQFEEEDLEDAGGGMTFVFPYFQEANFLCKELFYRDFFDPPSRVPSTKAKAKAKASVPSHSVNPPTPGRVRFHEEVRVRNFKANGKNLPLSTMYSIDDEDDEDGDDEFGEQMTFGDFDAEQQRANFLNDDDDDKADFSDNSEDDEYIGGGESEEGLDDTIERLKDDLFAEEEEPENSSSLRYATYTLLMPYPIDLSTHEKRMASLQKQIKELEAENVAKKDWVLMGEATSKARPQNSLLEEDLEFERLMKAVPVITEEIVQGLEERIKARILDGRFDDVVRLRPVDDKPFLPSRFFEIQDTKSSQSLSQIYEDEYTATQTGGVAGDDRDGKLKKEHEEIEKLWEGICGKLDALCNAHFTPKQVCYYTNLQLKLLVLICASLYQPKASISTVANVSAASLESALPTSKSVSTMLAPEEVFAPSSSDLRARSELTPAEKRALRTKERKARKKTRDALDKGIDKYAKAKGVRGVKKQKEAALQSVVKSGKGVTVVGKKSKDILAKKNRAH